MTIGIDFGISATKIVLMNGTRAINMEIWEGEFTSDRLQAYIQKNVPRNVKVDLIAVTGIGAEKAASISGYKKKTVDEFEANATAASYVCNEERFIVTSIGTATSFVLVEGKKTKHIGGSALGGGTLLSLFSMAMNGGGWQHLRMLAERGDLMQIDKVIADVSDEALPDLPMDTTVVNLGKVDRDSRPEDIILGLENLVLQNIGVMANLAGRGYGIRHFVMLGRMVTLPHADEIFARLEKLYNIKIIVPSHAEFMTAIGAALYGI